MGRTQVILYYLRQIKQNDMVPGYKNFPVYVDSPLAVEATEIFLEISEGPKETEATEEAAYPDPKPEETEAPAPVSKKTISFALPKMDTSYTVTIYRDGTPIVSDVTIQPGSEIFNLPDVEGSGTSMFELWVDGEFYSSHPVEF